MLLAEENGAEVSQKIDCISQRHAASIQSISDDVKSKQK